MRVMAMHCMDPPEMVLLKMRGRLVLPWGRLFSEHLYGQLVLEFHQSSTWEGEVLRSSVLSLRNVVKSKFPGDRR